MATTHRFAATLCSAAVSVTLVGAPSAALAAPPTPPAANQPSPASTPSSGVDEVRLKSGGFVRGSVSEYVPGDYVVIMPAGQTEARRFEWADVDRVVLADQATGTAPTPTPSPVPQPSPIPEPAAEPPPGPAPAEEESAATKNTPLVVIEQVTKPENLVALYRITGEAVASGGGVTAHAVGYAEICQSPCNTILDSWQGEFFVMGDRARASSRFRFQGQHDNYLLRVKPGSKGLAIGGYVVLATLPVAGILLALVPVFENMPKSKAPAFYVGGSVLAAAGLAGGIAMFAFSRSKVEVLPGAAR